MSLTLKSACLNLKSCDFIGFAAQIQCIEVGGGAGLVSIVPLDLWPGTGKAFAAAVLVDDPAGSPGDSALNFGRVHQVGLP